MSNYHHPPPTAVYMLICSTCIFHSPLKLTQLTHCAGDGTSILCRNNVLRMNSIRIKCKLEVKANNCESSSDYKNNVTKGSSLFLYNIMDGHKYSINYISLIFVYAWASIFCLQNIWANKLVNSTNCLQIIYANIYLPHEKVRALLYDFEGNKCIHMYIVICVGTKKNM